MKNDETTTMMTQLHKEVISCIIANTFDFGEIPTVETVKSNWQYLYFNIANDNKITDDTIINIIDLVSRYYN